jgi:hypothetical protein
LTTSEKLKQNGHMGDVDRERRQWLDGYLARVVQTLISSGIIRFHTGHSPLQIVREEPAKVLGLVARDLKESGIDLAKALRDEFLGSAFRAFKGRLFGEK